MMEAKIETLAPDILAAVSALTASCTSPPPFSGTLVHRSGTLRLRPDGGFEMAVEPLNAKQAMAAQSFSDWFAALGFRHFSASSTASSDFESGAQAVTEIARSQSS